MCPRARAIKECETPCSRVHLRETVEGAVLRGACPPAASARPAGPDQAFARIKPISADKDGGVVAAKGLGSLALTASSRSAGEGSKRYDRFAATIPPEAEQPGVDRLRAFVTSWLDEYDVDLICYGQTVGEGVHDVWPPFMM